MKKLQFIPQALLCAAMTVMMTACPGSNDNEPDVPVPGPTVPADDAKAYIEETAKSVIGMFNPEEQRVTMELCGYFDRVYGEYEMPSAWENVAASHAPGRFMHTVGQALITSS